MRIERIDPATLSLADLVNAPEGLYHITPNMDGGYIMGPLEGTSLSFLQNEYLIVRVGDDEDFVPQPVEKPIRKRENLTYKIESHDSTESIFVAFRPENGGIRISFKDKDAAEMYFNYFREQFYTSKTGASVITVSNIYSDLGLVNWNHEDCDDWGWYTLDGGTCRYITEVTKTRGTKMWGFLLKRPTKLYETKKREA